LASRCGLLKNILIHGYSTSATFQGIRVTQNNSYLGNTANLFTNLGVVNCTTGIAAIQTNFYTQEALAAADDVVAISGCTYGISSNGGWISCHGQITGNSTGLIAQNSGFAAATAAKIVGNTTASSPAQNTVGNSNSYVSY
jgi:L-lactate utilization protein LutC